MKKILFSVLMLAAVPVFAGVSSTFPYGLKASTITVTGQSTLSSTTVNNLLTATSATSLQTVTVFSTMSVYGAVWSGENCISTAGGGYGNAKVCSVGAAVNARFGNIAFGSAFGNSTIFALGNASINLGNALSESQTFTTANGITNATAATQFTARIAASNTTADPFRYNVSLDGGSTTDTGVYGLNIGKNLYTKYGLIVGSTITLGGFTYTYPSSLGASSQQLTLDSVYTSSATLKWATPAGSGDVLAAGNNTMSGTNNFTGTVQIGGAVAYIPVIVASGTMHEVASKTFNVSFQDNRRYELVFISTCTTAADWGIRFNGDTGNHYAHSRTYTYNGGTSGDVSTSDTYGLLADNYNATTNLWTLKSSIQVRKNDPLASVIMDWQEGIGAVGQGLNNNVGHTVWSVANTLPTTMTLVHMSGTCSGAYLITTTAWDASF